MVGLPLGWSPIEDAPFSMRVSWVVRLTSAFGHDFFFLLEAFAAENTRRMLVADPIFEYASFS